jgi:hypothetical protein
MTCAMDASIVDVIRSVIRVIAALARDGGAHHARARDIKECLYSSRGRPSIINPRDAGLHE